jgi:hypothetical protein
MKSTAAHDGKVPTGNLKSLEGAFGFTYKTQTSSEFLVHFDFNLEVAENGEQLLFNSKLVSDGGMKKKYPNIQIENDNNLKLSRLKSAENKKLDFEATGASGKKLQIQLKEDGMGWRVASLTYFGSATQVEGSWATALWAAER